MSEQIIFRKQRRFWEVDPRIKFIVAVLGSTMFIVVSKEVTLFSTFVIALIWCVYCGKWKNAVALAVVYGAFQYHSYMMLVSGSTSGMITTSTMFRRLLVIGAFMTPLVSSKISELIGAMYKLKLPRFVIIGMATIFRFLPTIKEEYIAVRNSQKVRGIGRSIINIILHPIIFYETLLIPLTIRIMKISDELSASAMLRGADRKGRGTCFTDVKITASDILILLFMLAGMVFALLLNYGIVVLEVSL